MLNLILDITWVRKEMILPFVPSYKLKKEQSFTQRKFHALIFPFHIRHRYTETVEHRGGFQFSCSS
jgi:hypothetical protein